jgi:two-component system, response regulator FlrC
MKRSPCMFPATIMSGFRNNTCQQGRFSFELHTMHKKVLFVDDDETWRKRVSASFAQADYEVLTAENASEAMALAETNPLGLIVLDVNLDGESGLILLKFLRHNHPGVPIMLFSCVEHDDAAIRSMLEMGADQYLPKSSMDELIVTVGSYMLGSN